MQCLSKDQILSAEDMKVEGPIEVPEWGGRVYLRVVTGLERGRLEQTQEHKNNKATFFERMLVQCLCDADGKKIFDPGDYANLAQKNAKVIKRLAMKAAKLNGFTEEEVEELEGNSDEITAGGSGSS